MKIYLSIIFTLVFSLSYSQCEDSDKLDLGGTYMSRSNNYIPFDLNISDTIQYCCDINKIKKYSDFIFLKAKNYITNRAGNDFYNKLEIYQLEVNFKDSIKVSYKNQSLYNLSNYNFTYWIIYTYINKNIKYAFGLEFDKKGKMISENKFPKYSKNVGFENLTDYCKALELVKANATFQNKKVKYIELAYLDEINSFCWLIEEINEPNKEFEKWEKNSVNQYFVNATNNKLEVVKPKSSFSISCGYGSPSK